MLVAFSFPEDEFVDIFSRMFNFLIKIGLDKKNLKRQWPHVSVAYLPKDLNMSEMEEVKSVLKQKPSFIGTEIAVFEGSGDNKRDYLVIMLKVSSEFEYAKKYLSEKFNAPQRSGGIPHVSIISFPKSQTDLVKSRIEELDLSDFIGKNFQSKYIQYWNKNDKKTEIAYDEVEDNDFIAVAVTEQKMKKKKKRSWHGYSLPPFYGKGDGYSAATMPPNKTPGISPKLGPSLPGPSGQNAPQFGTMAIVADKEFDAAMKICESMGLHENFHFCPVCDGTKKEKTGIPCRLCEKEASCAAMSPVETCLDGGGADNINSFAGFSAPWDAK